MRQSIVGAAAAIPSGFRGIGARVAPHPGASLYHSSPVLRAGGPQAAVAMAQKSATVAASMMKPTIMQMASTHGDSI